MATEVLLMSDVKDLGKEGDVVNVADGFARNYLLPRNLAAPVTPATRRRLEKLRKERAAARTVELEKARALDARLRAISVTIPVKTNEEEKMYGSVTANDIATRLQQQGFEIDRAQVVLPEPLRELDVFQVPVRLDPEVESSVKVWIVKE